jgi:hypothetical protein
MTRTFFTECENGETTIKGPLLPNGGHMEGICDIKIILHPSKMHPILCI